MNVRDRIVAFIISSTKERGYPPSVREIGQAVGLSSTSTVHHHLEILEDEDRLVRDRSRARALRVLPGGKP